MQLKLSRYTVTTDTFPGTDEVAAKVLYCSLTGQALTVQEDLVSLLQQGQLDLLSYDELEKLISIEAIVPAEENELHTVIEQNRDFLKDNTTLSYIIQPTAQCQLGCDYCGQQHTKKQLAAADYDKVLARIETKLRMGIYKALRISWFGSEPLMGYTNLLHLVRISWGYPHGSQLPSLCQPT